MQAKAAPAVPEGPSSPAAAADEEREAHAPTRRRRIAVGAIVVVAALLLGISTYAVWTKAFALNTDVWTATSDDLIADPVIRDALAVYVTSQLFSDEAVHARLAGVLPTILRPLAGPVSITVAAATEEAVARILATERAQRLFVAANRLAHSEFVKVIQDDDVTAAVQLDLGGLIAEVGASLGLPSTFTAGVAARAGKVTILESERLGTIRHVTHALELLSFWLLIAVVALWALAIYLSPGRRRQTLLWISLSVVAICLLLLVGRRLLGEIVVEQVVQDPTYVPAANQVWKITTGLLVDATVATLFFAALAFLGLQLAAPGRRATALRRRLAPWLRERPLLVWGTWALAVLLVLLFGPSSETRSLLAIAVIVALSAAGMWALRRQILAEFPGEPAPSGEPAVAAPEEPGLVPREE